MSSKSSPTPTRQQLSGPAPRTEAGRALFPHLQAVLAHVVRSPVRWAFLQMTGLDPSRDRILSMACFITDAQLAVVDPAGFEAVIHHPPAMLDAMDEWCTRTHGASGLSAAVLASTTSSTHAADALLAYIRRHVPDPRTALLAGNSVHADKMFLARAPYDRVLDWLHYRIFDVSAIKEAVRRWCPDPVVAAVPRKQGRHEARADVLESIEEARFYMRLFQRMMPVDE